MREVTVARENEHCVKPEPNTSGDGERTAEGEMENLAHAHT